jgi:hypothetical protein
MSAFEEADDSEGLAAPFAIQTARFRVARKKVQSNKRRNDRVL